MMGAFTTLLLVAVLGVGFALGSVFTSHHQSTDARAAAMVVRSMQISDRLHRAFWAAHQQMQEAERQACEDEE